MIDKLGMNDINYDFLKWSYGVIDGAGEMQFNGTEFIAFTLDRLMVHGVNGKLRRFFKTIFNILAG